MKSKTELVVKVAKKHELSEKKAAKLVNTVFAEIQAAVLDGNRVMIREFGTFSLRPTRTGGKLPNGTQWSSAPRKSIRFEPHAASGGPAKKAQEVKSVEGIQAP